MNSSYMMKSLNEPLANLTVTIYQYAMSPYDDWNQIAWGASLLIMIAVLLLNLAARFAVRGKKI